MTTKIMEELYLAQHRAQHENKKWAFYNPNNIPLEQLPTIYGFNNGGPSSFLHATLIAEDGTWLGGHACSHEGYMTHDLGILEGTRPDRHEGFKKHYPNGYKMVFVSYNETKENQGLQNAFKKADEKEKANPPIQA